MSPPRWPWLSLLLACSSPSPSASPPEASSRPSPGPTGAASAASAPPAPQPARVRCDALSLDERPGYLGARCGGEQRLLLLATRDDPQRYRPSVALSRLATSLGLRVVPPTEAVELSLRELLDGADDPARKFLSEEAAIKANGTISAALIEAPRNTRPRATRWSNEEQRWTRLVESPSPLSPAEQAEAEDWASVLALDYLSAAILRRSVEQGDDGRLWLVDNQKAFHEHPEQLAVDQILARLKRCRHLPAGLAPALARLDEATLEASLRRGPYDRWMIHQRPLREVFVRARALSSWLHEGRRP